MWKYNNSDVLYHHGTLGMKWGVRRYQNKNGTLTSAGTKRYDRDQRENSGKKKGNKVGTADPHRWVKEDMERTKRLTDASSNLNSNLKSINKRKMDDASKNRTRMDLSKMSDKEMREQINREILERQYSDMFAPQKVSKGRENVSKVLDATGNALMLTSSALGIALAVKELKG